tara:strand:+ start:1074 stop:1331 length:258 start_codon:yes stop_codon:yes gene_type:complete
MFKNELIINSWILTVSESPAYWSTRFNGRKDRVVALTPNGQFELPFKWVLIIKRGVLKCLSTICGVQKKKLGRALLEMMLCIALN